MTDAFWQSTRNDVCAETLLIESCLNLPALNHCRALTVVWVFLLTFVSENDCILTLFKNLRVSFGPGFK